MSRLPSNKFGQLKGNNCSGPGGQWGLVGATHTQTCNVYICKTLSYACCLMHDIYSKHPSLVVSFPSLE